MRADEPPTQAERCATAAARVRRAMTEISMAATSDLRQHNPSEYFALNRLWHEADAIAKALEAQT